MSEIKILFAREFFRFMACLLRSHNYYITPLTLHSSHSSLLTLLTPHTAHTSLLTPLTPHSTPHTSHSTPLTPHTSHSTPLTPHTSLHTSHSSHLSLLTPHLSFLTLLTPHLLLLSLSLHTFHSSLLTPSSLSPHTLTPHTSPLSPPHPSHSLSPSLFKRHSSPPHPSHSLSPSLQTSLLTPHASHVSHLSPSPSQAHYKKLMKLVDEATEQYQLKISPGGRIEGSEDTKIEPPEEMKLELNSSDESEGQSEVEGPIPEPGNGTSRPGVAADPWSVFIQQTSQTLPSGDDVSRGSGQIGGDSTSDDQQNGMETSQQDGPETSHVGPKPAWSWNVEAPVFHSSLCSIPPCHTLPASTN